MTIESVDFGDFCREWTIFHRGEHEWEDMVENDARFVIVRKKDGYQFIPIIGVKDPLRRKPLQADPNNGHGRYEDGTPLAGSLVGKFGNLDVRFTLNKGTDEFVISLSNAADLQTSAHGGPHGSD